MQFTKLSDIDKKFAEKIKAAVREESDLERLLVTPNGVAFIKHRDQPGLTPLGCVVCIKANISRTPEGYPEIDGQALLPYNQFVDLPKYFGDEMKANLWVCPRCKFPIMKLLPKFVPKL